MAKSRPSVQKRNKERNRIEKKLNKAARRARREEERPEEVKAEGDPDLAGIVAGPQPAPGYIPDDLDRIDYDNLA